METTYENRKFMIFDVSELNQVDFSQVLETSEETVVKSLDETKTFVKWESEEIPNSIFNLTTKQGPYTYNEIIQILNEPEWCDKNATEYFIRL